MAETEPKAIEARNKESETKRGYSHQAYRILQFVFVVLPILAGLDKFFYFLTNWGKYLSPEVPQYSTLNTPFIMMIAGLIEIAVGICVAFKPKVFAYIIALWLLLVFINLIILGKFFDVALRDGALCLSAFALARLSHEWD